MTKRRYVIKNYESKTNANTLASEDLMSLPTCVTKGIFIPEMQEAELAVA